MSYRTKAEIYGDVHSWEARSGSRETIIGACLGLMAPGIGRILAKTGWFSNTELLEWGTIFLGLACIAGGAYFGWRAKKQAQEDVRDGSNG